ncbi:MAG: HAD family hydrolase [Spirochaetes bacterium]|jgi:phosphoglycolate phosphatase|nr:HAD family hydrolase [Spirochaetota bacterium]
MKYKGIIFDLDGTLLDTLDDLSGSFNHALKESGFGIHDTGSYKSFIGEGAKKCIEKALPESSRNEAVINRILVIFSEHYLVNCRNKTRPYEGIAPVLAELKSMGNKLFVITNKPQKFADIIISFFFPDEFDLVVGEGGGFPKKPAPGSVLHVAELYNLPLQSLVIIGDSGTDILTAKNAGIDSIGVEWGFRTGNELVNSGADRIIGKPSDILKIISGR